MDERTTIIVDRGNSRIPLSKIINDCKLDLCVTTYRNESLASILKKLCDRIDGVDDSGIPETDPIFTASAAGSITSLMISHWNNAFSWGNHALAGYLTSLIHNHGIANNNGAQQFTYGVGENLRFQGGGSVSITFDPATKKIIFTGANTNYYVDSVSWDSSSGILTLGRTAPLSPLTISLDGRYLRSFTEGDPIANAKTVTLIQGSGIIVAGGPVQSLGANPLWNISISTPYIRGLFVPGFGISYNSTTGSIAQTNKIEIRFTVGATGAPVAGATSFTLTDCAMNPLTGVKINFFKERMLLLTPDDYSFNDTTGLINMVQPLIAGQRIRIQAETKDIWQICNLSLSGGSGPSGDAFLINDTDHLMINDTDHELI